MSLTDTYRDEMQRILAWAEKNSSEQNHFIDNSGDKDSTCFVRFDNRGDWMEYGFGTVPQLKEALKEMWTGSDYMQEIVMACTIGAFKAKPVDEKFSSDKKRQSDDVEIKDFVYMF